MTRKVLYVTGTRADFGLMASTLQQIHAHPALELQIAVTGMHLNPAYGRTVNEIEALGLPIVARIPTNVDDRTQAAMSQGIGEAIIGLTKAMSESKPDLVLLIGDRGEMLAGAIAGIHLGIPVVHMHGGERSGTVDEPVRHAITKLSHWHFVATEESRDRVIRLGERPDHVWITGAPSLDGLAAFNDVPRDEVTRRLGITPGNDFVLVLFHPIVQEMDDAHRQTIALANALQHALPANGIDIVWLDPNADAGSGAILEARNEAIAALGAGRVHRITHLPRPEWLAALRHARVLIGNSSSGIIESASFGTPVVNIGNRQRARERNLNTIDCEAQQQDIADAVLTSLARERYAPANVYGDGHAGERVTQLLATQTIAPDLLDKVNTY